MFIMPIQPIGSLEQLNAVKKIAPTGEGATVPFKSLFVDALNDVKDNDALVKNEIYKLSTGQTDDLHNLSIASTKAALSVDLLVQLRNKANDAYSEIMRMGL